MSKTILVTGASGFIGSHTCVELLQSGFNVVALDNLCNSSPRAIERVSQITGKRVALQEADIRDRAALDAILAAHQIDAVIHFAGLKAVGESVEKPLLNHLALLVDSYKEHVENAKERGLEYEEVDAANTWAVFVTGPYGIRIEYVEHASLSLDMIILMQTVVCVIKGLLPKRKPRRAKG